MYNSIADLARYFSKDSRPVSLNEWVPFWRSLSNEEKEYFRTASL